VDHEEAFESSCVVRGEWRVLDDGELHEEEDATIELSSPASVAGALSCKRALDDTRRMALQTLGPNGDGVLWGWSAPAKSKLGG
jgi:hypothetical protein